MRLPFRQHGDKAQIRRAEGVSDLDLELGGAFLARLQRQGAAFVALHVEAVAGLHFKLHIRRRVEVAEHPGAHVEHVPRRDESRYVWRDHERSAHLGCGLADAHAVGIHRHREQVQLAVKTVGHLVMQHGVAGRQVHQPGPPGHGRLMFYA